MYIQLVMPSQDYLGRKKFVFESETETDFETFADEIKETLTSVFPHLAKVIEHAEMLERSQMPDYGQDVCQHCGQTFNKQHPKDKYCSLECSKNAMREKVRLRQQTYREDAENKKKQKFRAIVNRKIKKGEIVLEQCSRCGATEKLQAHHISYKDGFELCIIPLCKKCHSKLHQD